ncbi:hypothetical protein MZO42_13630 [Sphingomonas psychrotolerans]|uniref:Uncharacterized protein n=1 Tax=Sphingomonas psychrotolerans TaxID=1327635 RepID=A0ABU3N5J4_9SPHN|nr:hypothetical protein [Sphingomonas psychrotolerans]MDT8759738.1 hypothetical protein [Sphingomonas psychrotolerans]
MTRALASKSGAAALAVLLLVAAGPALAQARPKADQTGGQQRRIRTTSGVQATQRISTRIQNRIQSRVQNRIDPNYVPQLGAATAIKAAKDEASRAGPARQVTPDAPPPPPKPDAE